MLLSTDTPSDLTSIQQGIRRSIPKQDLQRWLTVRPLRAYRDLALDWLGILAALAVIAWMPTWWTFGVGFLVIGFRQYALFILGHDALHGSLHPNRTVNDRLAKWLIYGPMFMGLEDGRRNHLEHHRHLGSTSDPDRYLHSLENKNSRLQFLLYCSGLATFGKTVLKVTPFGKLLSQSLPSPTQTEIQSPETQTSVIQTSAIQTLVAYGKQRLSVLIMQPLIISMFVLLGLPWWSYLVLWIAPIYFCVFLPDEIRAFCDHGVLLISDEQADPHRLVSFTPSWFEAILFSPHNMNYHAEHHLWPTIPYYNLPTAHETLKNNPEITVKKSYLLALADVIRALPVKKI